MSTISKLRSRGSTLRTKLKPLGDKSRPSVALGNLLTSRAIVIIMIIAAKGCWWVLEQPSTSLMHLHPLFQAMLKLLEGVRKKTIRMSKFGAPTKKPTLLYSSASCWHFSFSRPQCFGWFNKDTQIGVIYSRSAFCTKETNGKNVFFNCSVQFWFRTNGKTIIIWNWNLIKARFGFSGSQATRRLIPWTNSLSQNGWKTDKWWCVTTTPKVRLDAMVEKISKNLNLTQEGFWSFIGYWMHQTIEKIQFWVPFVWVKKKHHIEVEKGTETYSFLSLSQCRLRFGEALSRSRTLHAKRIQRRAKTFLKIARRTTNSYNMDPKVNRAWVKHADLQPIFDFLAGKWFQFPAYKCKMQINNRWIFPNDLQQSQTLNIAVGW